ncbi:MAG: hypothetical protein IKI67_01960 [Bacteroidales bacterium]|nr:hypothetical protein [Bacteroidales bacterium]
MKKIPKDIEIGWYHDEEHFTNTKLTLRFRSNGEAYLEYDDYCVGISAGNSIGGTYERPLPEGFPKGWTLEEFAESRPRYRDLILKNKRLKIFFQQYA